MAMLWAKWRRWQSYDGGAIDGGSDGVSCELREKDGEDGVDLACHFKPNRRVLEVEQELAKRHTKQEVARKLLDGVRGRRLSASRRWQGAYSILS
jgi:hypothetical protein